MSVTLVMFYLAGFLAIAGAIGVVAVRNVVHAAIFLLLSLVSVAAVFLFLYADFLALVQLLIYAGAVVILLLFGLMLTRAGGGKVAVDNPQKPLAILAAAVILAILGYASVSTRWMATAGVTLQRVDITQLGDSLFTKFVVPFEVASLVLLVALIGAIVIAKVEERT